MFYIHSDLQSLCSKSVSSLSGCFHFPGVNNKIFTFSKNTLLLTFRFLINTDIGLYKRKWLLPEALPKISIFRNVIPWQSFRWPQDRRCP